MALFKEFNLRALVHNLTAVHNPEHGNFVILIMLDNIIAENATDG